MMKMLKELLKNCGKVKVIVVDSEPMPTDEYVFAFLVDRNTAFFKAIMQLMNQMKSDALEACNERKATDRERLDALARIGALDDLRATIYFQMDNAVKQRDVRNARQKS